MKTNLQTLPAITLFFFLGSFFTVSAQINLSEQLDSIFENRYQQAKTAASLVVTKHGKAVYQKYSGLSNIELNISANAKTKFVIGSITKQFTATAILLLQEQGLLSTNDYVESYFPDFDKANYPIKIKHLLTHTSGLPSRNSSKDHRINCENQLSPGEQIALIKDEPLLFTPGEKYDYSNNGYILLGLIIESVSGKSYADYLQEFIFTPCQMKDTEIGNKHDIVFNRASGYTSDDNENLINAPWHSSFSAGAIISTPTDLNKWVEALFSSQIISKESLAEMLQNHELSNGDKLNLGYGWELNKIGSHSSYEHSGFEPGFKCYSIYLPEEKIYVISFQNSDTGSPSAMTINAAAIASNVAYPAIKQSKHLSASQNSRFVGTYLFGENKERIIGFRKGALFYKASGGLAQPLYAINDSTLIFKEGYRQLVFSKITDYKTVGYFNRIYQSSGVKMSDQIPEENRAISIPTEGLNKYVGLYESEQFNMTISLENESLFAQPEGSEKLKLIPKGVNKFFIEEIGAEIEFVSSNSKEKQVQVINILLEGNHISGVRK